MTYIEFPATDSKRAIGEFGVGLVGFLIPASGTFLEESGNHTELCTDARTMISLADEDLRLCAC